MKHRLFLIAALFACVLGGLAAPAEDAAPSSTPKGKILEKDGI